MENSKQIAKELASVRDYLRWAVSRFCANNLAYGHGTDNPVDEARFLVYSTLNLPLDSGDWVLDAKLTAEEKDQLLMVLKTRIEDRVPAPYLTGEAWFAGLPFIVDERVLVPRSPIAELIEAGYQPWLGDCEAPCILDLCCGSGCIGIATAMYLEQAQLDIADISLDALEVARRNIERHNLNERVAVCESDLFDGLGDKQYDLIVSNPPYVDAADLAAMPSEYQHEPALGLAAGDDGLDIVRRILVDAPGHLSENGVLIVEVGNSAEALCDAFSEYPFLWLEFERGGHGVFLLTAAQLRDSVA